jgi:hypothetical protein
MMQRLRLATPCVLAFALAASSGTASAQRIDGAFSFEDETVPELAGVTIVIDGTDFVVEGGVRGVGTAGDLVQILYIAEFPTKANADDVQGRVRQGGFSTLVFAIASDVPERDIDHFVTPEKCSVDGKVNVSKDEGKVRVACSAADLFAGLTADQLASIQAAFLENPKVKLKADSDGAKGSLKISSKGELFEEF